MPTVTGRTLDDSGEPIPGTGFEYDEDGLIADLLSQRVGPLNSHPTRPTWGAPLARSEDGPGHVRILSIFGAGFEGPPEHYHEVSRESFDVRQGEVVFSRDGTERTVAAGETVTIETGTPHTFRNPDEELTVVITTIAPLGRIGYVLTTLSGIAHDSDVDADDPLQQAVIAKRLDGDTVFTEAESGLRAVATDVLAPLGKLRGYQGGYGRYRQPAFWERHVEQPA